MKSRVVFTLLDVKGNLSLSLTIYLLCLCLTFCNWEQTKSRCSPVWASMQPSSRPQWWRQGNSKSLMKSLNHGVLKMSCVTCFSLDRLTKLHVIANSCCSIESRLYDQNHSFYTNLRINTQSPRCCTQLSHKQTKNSRCLEGKVSDPNICPFLRTKEQMVSPDCMLMRGDSRGMGRVSVTGHDWPLIQPRTMNSEWYQISNLILSSFVQPRTMLSLHPACYIWLHFAFYIQTKNLQLHALPPGSSSLLLCWYEMRRGLRDNMKPIKVPWRNWARDIAVSLNPESKPCSPPWWPRRLWLRCIQSLKSYHLRVNKLELTFYSIVESGETFSGAWMWWEHSYSRSLYPQKTDSATERLILFFQSALK